MKKQKKVLEKQKTTSLKSRVSDLPRAYVRGALNMSDSTGGRGDSNDKSGG